MVASACDVSVVPAGSPGRSPNTSSVSHHFLPLPPSLFLAVSPSLISVFHLSVPVRLLSSRSSLGSRRAMERRKEQRDEDNAVS